MARSPTTDRLNYMGGFTNIANHDPLDSLLLDLRKLPRWRTHWITERDEGRPSLTAYDIYGTPDLFWVPIEYNGLITHLLYRAGTKIELPSPNDLRIYLRKQVGRLSGLVAPPTAADNALVGSSAGSSVRSRARELTV